MLSLGGMTLYVLSWSAVKVHWSIAMFLWASGILMWVMPIYQHVSKKIPDPHILPVT